LEKPTRASLFPQNRFSAAPPFPSVKRFARLPSFRSFTGANKGAEGGEKILPRLPAAAFKARVSSGKRKSAFAFICF
jgi:hypothetical protein